FGGRVLPAPEPVHGEISHIRHRHPLLFAGIPQDFAAVRYHSLLVDPDLPACLEAIAWTPEGLLMGLAHRHRPLWGIQFHPESICTEHGETLVRNFLDQVPRRVQVAVGPLPKPAAPRWVSAAPAAGRVFHWRRLAHAPPAEGVFGHLFADCPLAFWLDTALPGPDARYSYMGQARTALRYDAGSQELQLENATGTQTRRQRLFDFLRACPAPAAGGDAPFPFRGGWVGYLGYEFRAESAGLPVPRSPHPDAVLLEADHFLVFDHTDEAVYLAFLGDPDEAAFWFDQVEGQLGHLDELPAVTPAAPDQPFSFRLRRSRRQYRHDIGRCLEAIRAGESYELCLTNLLEGPALADPWSAYRVLRHLNPAPYAAFLRLGDLCLLCSSPEQFLRVDAQGQVSTRPIKGTRPRGENPSADEALRQELGTAGKDRAENLMITDLLRHDLGRVCRTGSVVVPSLMAVETFAGYHQLVSTIQGRLRPGLVGLDCLQAAFPGGSMTGAPKLRSMELLDQIEGGPRGPYSGALGFLGADGSLELNIIIRTAVVSRKGTSIGAGGAIVARSEPEAELAELLLKARPVLDALTFAQTGRRVVSPGEIE
ncbi:MAG: aminodeoxychorismate synthase component I, partial [Candidatus Latescibacteria bacterium]|nr:aminodeoxychorismate synthase component I [Candidatus Latescibacterota bacterium]